MVAEYGGATAERQRTKCQERPAGQAWGGSYLERAGTVETLNSLDLMFVSDPRTHRARIIHQFPFTYGAGGCFAGTVLNLSSMFKKAVNSGS